MAALTLIVAFSAHVQAQTGLYHTPAEIEEWNKRRANGPYQSNWQFVEKQARAWYNSNPSVWAGATSNSCFSGPDMSHVLQLGIQSTALIALLDNNNAYRSAVRDFLVAQAKEAGTDFSNSNRWCAERGALSNHRGLLFITHYLRRLITAYSFIRADIAAADRQVLDAWFYDAGVFVAQFTHNVVAGRRFPNRRNDDYSACEAACPGKEFGTMYYGSEMTHHFHNGWGNITMMRGAFMAEVAVLLEDAWLEEEAKRLFKEWVKYAVFPGGAVFDLHRWNNTGEPQRGWRYAGLSIGSAVSIADVFARAGDFELYEYETSDGKYGSEGGPKSLRQAATFYANITLHNTKIYASTTATSDPARLIDAFNENTNKGWVMFVDLARPGVYYGDRVLKEAYDMDWPSPLGHDNNRQGSGHSYPSILAMFGGFENNPPYPDHPDQGGGKGGSSRQEIALQEGWNQVASSVEMEEPDMEEVLAELPEVTFVKDEAGRIYSPRYDINSIGTWKPTEGYKVYATTPATLSLEGEPLSPQDTPIQLKAGWSIVPFILEEALPVEEAFASIADVLVLAKDGEGNVYFPEGNVSDLKELQPGQGYLIYLSEDATLVYPDAGQRAAAQKQGARAGAF